MPDSATVPINVTAYDLAQTIGVVYIVRDLAQFEPYRRPDKDADCRCVFCNKGDWESHDYNCLWLRAARVEQSGVLDGHNG